MSDCTTEAESLFKYNLASPENRGSVSFLTFDNIEKVVIPEIKELEAAKERELAEDLNSNSTNSALKKSIAYDFLTIARRRWEQFLRDYRQTNDKLEAEELKQVNDWFVDHGPPFSSSHFDQDGKYPDNHWTGIVPQELASNADELSKDAYNEFYQLGLDINEKKTNLENINRIHFLGGGSTMELELAKHKSIQQTRENPNNKNFEDSELEGNHFEMQIRAFAQVYANFNNLDGSGTTDEQYIGEGTEDETRIKLILGDPDPLDDFTVDVYLDPKYNTFAFKTVSGRSSCPWEGGNLVRIEDPVIKLIQNAPRHVPSNQPLIFKVEMYNRGNTTVPLEVFVDPETNSGDMEVEMNGDTLHGRPIFFFTEDNKRYQSTISVHRGPVDFQYPSLNLWYRSVCENEMNVINVRGADQFAAANLVLSNYEDNESNPGIEFAEPCPEVRWAGEAMRFSSMNVNADAAAGKSMELTIFNVKSHIGPLLKEKSKRLDGVFLKYKRKFSPDWLTAKTKNDEGILIDADFAMNGTEAGLGKDPEDTYGFATLNWYFDTLLDGEYEIRVDSACTAGPSNVVDEYSLFSTNAIGVLIDRFAPQVYGKASPEVAPNKIISPYEEVVIDFSEVIQCRKPYTFDITVDLTPSGVRLSSLSDLIVQCNKNIISFHFRPDKYDEASGSEATVSIVGVEDLAGNTMVHGYTFTFQVCAGECWTGTSSMQSPLQGRRLQSGDSEENGTEIEFISKNAILRGDGCDGVDQNKNGLIDDCNEDQSPPLILLSNTYIETSTLDDGNKFNLVKGLIKSSTLEAQHFLKDNIHVSDDCAINLNLNVELNSTDSTGSIFKVTASDKRCAGVPNNIGEATSTEYFHVDVFHGYDSVTKFMGCDGVDQNGNGLLDDCDEDRSPPEIKLLFPDKYTMRASEEFEGAIVVTNPKFGSIEEAKLFLTENIEVSDDCATDLDVNVANMTVASCDMTLFRVSVSDPSCSDVNPIQTVQKEFILFVDDLKPIVTIGFDRSPIHLFSHGEKEYLHVMELSKSAFTDVNFWYKVEVSS